MILNVCEYTSVAFKMSESKSTDAKWNHKETENGAIVQEQRKRVPQSLVSTKQ